MRKVCEVYLVSSSATDERGVELTFPVSQYEMMDAFEQIHTKSPGDVYWQVDEFYCFDYLAPHLDENMSIFEFNSLTEQLSKLDSYQETALEGLLQMQVNKHMQENGGPITAQELMMLASNVDRCQVLADVNTDEALGKFYVENGFREDLDALPDMDKILILKLIHLEIKKYQLKTYFLAIGIISLVILGFLYTFALIAYAGGEVDAIEFSTYENIWTLINALQTVAYAVLISVMFSTFIIKEYAGKLNLLLFTYPVDKSTLLKAKVLLVAFSGIGGMLLGSALIFLIFFITERIFPLVPDTFSFGNIIKIWSELLLCSVYALCVGIVATKIGFIKMSVQTTIVSAIIIASCSANVISTMSYTNFPFLFLWGIMAIISIISYCNIVHKTIRMDI